MKQKSKNHIQDLENTISSLNTKILEKFSDNNYYQSINNELSQLLKNEFHDPKFTQQSDNDQYQNSINEIQNNLNTYCDIIPILDNIHNNDMNKLTIFYEINQFFETKYIIQKNIERIISLTDNNNNANIHNENNANIIKLINIIQKIEDFLYEQIKHSYTTLIEKLTTLYSKIDEINNVLYKQKLSHQKLNEDIQTMQNNEPKPSQKISDLLEILENISFIIKNRPTDLLCKQEVMEHDYLNDQKYNNCFDSNINSLNIQKNIAIVVAVISFLGMMFLGFKLYNNKGELSKPIEQTQDTINYIK